MGRIWAVGLVAALAALAGACGGAVAPTGDETDAVAPPSPDAGNSPATYRREGSYVFSRTGTGQVEIAIACLGVDSLVDRGCVTSGGATLVDSRPGGAAGWECYATASGDGASVEVWVECLSTTSDAGP